MVSWQRLPRVCLLSAEFRYRLKSHFLVLVYSEGFIPFTFGPSYRKSWRARKAVAKAQVLTQLGRPADDDEE
jgi:hypothetical protein